MIDKRTALKILFLQKRVTLKEIAEELGVTPAHVSGVLAGYSGSRSVVEAAARKVDMDADAFREAYIPRFKRVAA